MATNTQNNNDGLTIQALFRSCWKLRWWMILSAFIALALAVCYVKVKTPIYERTTWIMMNNADSGNSDMALISEFTGTSGSRKIDNEVFILQSPTLMSKVVDELGLNTRYYHYVIPIFENLHINGDLFSIKAKEMYKDSPFWMNISSDSELTGMGFEAIYVKFVDIDGKSYKIKQMMVDGEDYSINKTTHKYGETLKIGLSKVIISRSLSGEIINGDTYLCTWNVPQATADVFIKNLTASVSGGSSVRNSTDIITLTYKDPIPERASNILNTLVTTTNNEYRQNSGLSSRKTIEFIDSRIADIAGQLGEAESEYTNYQSSRSLVNLESQSQMQLSSDMQYKNQMTEVSMQLKILEMVSEMIGQNAKDEHNIIPANIGISDNGLNNIITNYNTLVAERNRMVANSSENNPRVLNLNSQLDDAKNSILMSISSLRQVYNLRFNELSSIVDQSQISMSSLPREQYQLQQISRKVDIIEPLYLLLQQKREEAQIALYSEVDNFRVIEEAFGSKIPVSPQGMKIYIIAIILGLAIPVVYIYLRNTFRYRVETKQDIENKIDVPVLSVLPTDGEDYYSLISETDRDVVAEAFRKLRSNIQYFTDDKVIQVTSSITGEGKSFVASNLALSLSHTGKSVVVIGLDLRKPTMHKIFNIEHCSLNHSLVGFLLGKVNRPEDIIINTKSSDKLDVIIPGIIPPNPSELLMNGKLEELIGWCSQHYDYIVLDSAPTFPVTDSILINKYANITLYCIRADYTELKMLDEINNNLKDNTTPLKNPYIVLNAVNYQSSKYKYRYDSFYDSRYGYYYGEYDSNKGKQKIHRKVTSKQEE